MLDVWRSRRQSPPQWKAKCISALDIANPGLSPTQYGPHCGRSGIEQVGGAMEDGKSWKKIRDNSPPYRQISLR